MLRLPQGLGTAQLAYRIVCRSVEKRSSSLEDRRVKGFRSGRQEASQRTRRCQSLSRLAAGHANVAQQQRYTLIGMPCKHIFVSGNYCRGLPDRLVE